MNAQASLLSPSIVAHQLSRILVSRTFSRAGYLRTFLELCVSETLQGNGGHLKEIWLGGEVFGRRGDFNPGIDPIVRVQARRLREKLALFYRTEGVPDKVQITMPVGSYVPVFSTTAHGRLTALFGQRAIAVAILPLKSMDAASSCIRISNTIASKLFDALVEVGTLKVVARAIDADFQVAGTARSAASSHRICLELTNTKTGDHCWSAWFDQRNTRFFPELQQVARILKDELCKNTELEAATFSNGQLPRSQAYSMSANPRFI